MIPDDHHIARICPKATLDNGAVSAASFEPKVHKSDGLMEEALSVHWLEHCQADGTLPDKFAALRAFLFASPIKPEFVPKKEGLIAAISVGDLHRGRVPDLEVRFECRHSPRMPDVGDPHSDVNTKDPPIRLWPDDEPLRLAIQQYICDQVVYSEPGKL